MSETFLNYFFGSEIRCWYQEKNQESEMKFNIIFPIFFLAHHFISFQFLLDLYSNQVINLLPLLDGML